MPAHAASVQLALIAEITTLLTTERIPHWLYGGWGIDVLAGTVTREHGDIDLVVWGTDAERVGPLLARHGYEPRPTHYPEERRAFVKGGEKIDVECIERTPTGQIVTPGRWKDWPWPDGAFTGAPAVLHGLACPVVSAAAQLDTKESYQHYAPDRAPRAVDRADIAVLRAVMAAQGRNHE